MKRTIQYIPPTSYEELQDFQKLNYNFKHEIWKYVPIDGWKHFRISTYGRLLNTKTSKLQKCDVNKINKININSIVYRRKVYYKRDYKKFLNTTICDMMLHAFYPDISDTHINPIPIDGNIFNLFLDNLKFVPNVYYEGDDEYKEEWIYIHGEKSKYTIDINGVVINQEKDKIIRPDSDKATDSISLSHRRIKYKSSTRMRLMAEVFIPNPHNLKNAKLIDETNTKPSLDNICWTNRKRRDRNDEIN